MLGTDGAIGKRTTATILTQALNDRGITAVLVGTGQTGLIQGGRYGVALDAIPCQFCSGEMEAAVVEAFEGEHPDVIIVEGQGALSHPAYLTSTFILRGSRPDAVILQHAPGRDRLGDFADVPMPTAGERDQPDRDLRRHQVIGLTINHENMTDAEVTAAITMYELELGIPATDALTRPPDRLVDMVFARSRSWRRSPGHPSGDVPTGRDRPRQDPGQHPDPRDPAGAARHLGRGRHQGGVRSPEVGAAMRSGGAVGLGDSRSRTCTVSWAPTWTVRAR